MISHKICCWVIALKAEAKPVIECFGLKKNAEFSRFGFEVFNSEDDTHYLIISGVGKIRSGSAVTWLGAQLVSAERLILWLNFGIAGNREATIGSVFRAGRIQESTTKRSWYPQPVCKAHRDKSISTGEILTVDQPCFDYPEKKWLVEMEAAGFVATASRFSSLEWIRCYKLVSDNQCSDPETITPAFVESLCAPALELINQELPDWLELGEAFLSQSHHIDCEPIIAEYHFSVTEQHQLKRLLQRAIILNKLSMKNYQSWATNNPAKSGKQLLQSLRQLLTDTESAEN